jgi:hypothetical protein
MHVRMAAVARASARRYQPAARYVHRAPGNNPSCRRRANPNR